MRLILLLLVATFGVTATPYAVFRITECWAPLWWIAHHVLVPLGVDPALWHETAERAGVVCHRCAQLAPGWWDWEVDCAGHNCGSCWTCTDVPMMLSPGWREGH